MNKRTPLLIVVGILLVVLFIGIKFTLSAISDRKYKNVFIEEIKKRDAKISQLDQQIEHLSTEKSLLTQKEMELEGKLKLLQDDIEAKTEREAALYKRAEGLTEEKQKLSKALAETTESMQEKLHITAEEAKKELERRKREYSATERKSLMEVTLLRKELETLNRDKEILKQMTTELVDELNQTRDDLAYTKTYGTANAEFHDKKNDKTGHKTEVKVVDKTEELSIEERFKQHYNQGFQYDYEGEYKQAIKEYQKALELMPNDPDLHYNMAIVYDDYINDKKNAIFHYRKYLELDPRSTDRVKVEGWLSKAIEDLKWQKKVSQP